MRLKILYFTLEVSKEEKFYEFLCHLLFKLNQIRIDPIRLKSTDAENPVPQEVLDLLASDRYQQYIQRFEECVEFIDDIRNPTGINKYCRAYALNPANGKSHLKEIEYTNLETGVIEKREVPDYYEPNDPDEIRIIIIDNYSNLTLESGYNKMQNIDKMSKYCITLRDNLNYSIVGIQHQAQSQEGIENFKLGKLKPSPDGLADCKTTIRDANMAIGLYSPYKYEIREYERYDITRFKNHIRFLEIMENRNGESGSITPLFFDGAVSTFEELPLPTDRGIDEYYNYLRFIREERTVEGDIERMHNSLPRQTSFYSFSTMRTSNLAEQSKNKSSFFNRIKNYIYGRSSIDNG